MNDPDLIRFPDLFNAFRSDLLSNLHCATLGLIESYDEDTGTASVRPVIRRRLKTGESIDPPLLESVPVFLPSADAEITPGMTCLLIFCDDCLDGFFASGALSDPAENRHHDYSDAIAIPDFRQPSP